jgi:hypothetical protein
MGMGVAEEQGKIINTLRERRRIEEAIRSLAPVSGPEAMEREAQRIAGMGDQVVHALIGLLDTSDPRLLRAIGLVALHLERGDVVLALRHVVTQSAHSDRVRLAALVILEKFLGEEPDDSLYLELQSPETAMAQSLVEMVDHASQDRDILREYVRAIEQQAGDVVELVFDITSDLGPECAVLPFWALAQSKRQEVAEATLHRLGSLKSPASAVMLQALLPTLLPERRALAERSLRKLRLSGVDVPPLAPPDPAWRALISPIDGQGSQSIWFWLDPPKDAPVSVFSVFINDLTGVWDAIYDRNGELAQCLPPDCLPGAVHQAVFPGASTRLPLLETAFDVGRRLVRQALAVNHAKNQAPPLGYAVLSDLLWQWDDRRLDERPPIERPSPAESAVLRARTADLLNHLAFETWFIQDESLLGVARQLGWGAPADRRPGQGQLLNELIRHYFGPPEVAIYCNRLENMAEWLWLAGEKDAARLAVAAALTLKEDAPENHPLTRRMVELGLAIALRGLALGAN